MDTSTRPKKFNFARLKQLFLTKDRLILLDLSLVVTAGLMVFVGPVFVILLFHIIFLLLTFGAFYWSFRNFAARAGFWVTITIVLLLRAIVDNRLYALELIEIPLLASMLVLVFMIAEERAKAKEKLHQSEERYHTLFDNLFKESRDAIFITDQEGTIVDANQALLDLFGYSREGITGLESRDLPHRPFATWDELIQRTGQVGSVRDYDIKLQRRDGTEMDCLLTLSLWRDPGGKLLGYQGIIRDITRRKKIEVERVQLLIKEREQRILAETQGEVFLALAAQTSYETVLDEILRQVQRIVSYSAANIVILKRGILHVARHQGYQMFSSRELMPDLRPILFK